MKNNFFDITFLKLAKYFYNLYARKKLIFEIVVFAEKQN